MAGVLDVDIYECCPQRPFDLGDRREQPLTVAGRHSVEQRGGGQVGQTIELSRLCESCGGPTKPSPSPIGRIHLRDDQAFVLKSSYEAARVARVEPKPSAQFMQIRAILPDLP